MLRQLLTSVPSVPAVLYRAWEPFRVLIEMIAVVACSYSLLAVVTDNGSRFSVHGLLVPRQGCIKPEGSYKTFSLETLVEYNNKRIQCYSKLQGHLLL